MLAQPYLGLVSERGRLVGAEPVSQPVVARAAPPIVEDECDARPKQDAGADQHVHFAYGSQGPGCRVGSRSEALRERLLSRWRCSRLTGPPLPTEAAVAARWF